MSYQVEPVTPSLVLGEGPHWDSERQALYFVDALASSIGRYLPAENRTTLCKVDPSGVVSIVIPVKGQSDKFLIALGRKLVEVTWDGESPEPSNVRDLVQVDREPGLEGNRFNDGKVDPTGKLWVGTLGGFDDKGQWIVGKGSLYSFSDTLQPRKHESGLTIANGLAWSADLKSMYYIDTYVKTVDVFDFDAATGSVANRRPIFDFRSLNVTPEEGGPDGMTIDTDGNLWVALFGGAGVFKIDPRTGKLLKKVDIPSVQTTSVAFGGPNLDELYVVSANLNLSKEDAAKYPEAGRTFRVTGLGVKGLPMLPVDLSKL